LPSENILLPAKGLLLTLQNLQRNPEVLMCFGGTVPSIIHTHTHTKGIPLRDVLRFHYHNEVQKHLLTLQAPNPHCGIADPSHCNGGGRKDQGQRLSVLVDYSFACTAWRKLISLLYRQTWYLNICYSRLG
jgi:hypothetical protein